jgi:hypothetical protein
MFRRLLPVCFLLAATPRLAIAQDAFAISSAREVAKSGIEDYFAGRYADANDKLTRAFEVVRVPTLALFKARSLAKLGKLVSASEIYLLAMRLPNGEGDAETQEQARHDARTERNELLLRIPRLRVAVTGVPAVSVSVLANDAKVPTSLLSSGWLVDPGSVKLVAVMGERRVEATEHFAEGEAKTVTLHFESAASLQTSPPNSTPGAAFPASPPTPGEHDTASRSGTRTAAWVSFGLGGVGLLAGIGTGMAALIEKQHLDDGGACDANHSCYGYVDTNRYRFLRNFSTGGFIVAAVGAATGTVLYFSSGRSNQNITSRVPHSPAASAITITPWIGAGQAGVSGVF